jgi:hypothetical protein
MEDVSYISYNSLIRRVNLYRQGIMPNSTIQEWYNGESTRPDCVILAGRIYLIIMFSGQDFEQRYLYRGVSSSQHIPDGSEHSDSDSDTDSATAIKTIYGSDEPTHRIKNSFAATESLSIREI